MVTIALGTTAALGSFTVPEMRPKTVCPCTLRALEASNTTSALTIIKANRLDSFVLCIFVDLQRKIRDVGKDHDGTSANAHGVSPSPLFDKLLRKDPNFSFSIDLNSRRPAERHRSERRSAPRLRVIAGILVPKSRAAECVQRPQSRCARPSPSVQSPRSNPRRR